MKRVLVFWGIFILPSLSLSKNEHRDCPTLISYPPVKLFDRFWDSREKKKKRQVQNQFLEKMAKHNDDASRLEYAEWLKSWGHPYGEFLMVDTQHPPDDFGTAHPRSEELRHLHQEDWTTAIVPSLASHVSFFRGTIHEASVEIPEILQGGVAHSTGYRVCPLEQLLKTAVTLRMINFSVPMNLSHLFEGISGTSLIHVSPFIPDDFLAYQLSQTAGELILTGSFLSGMQFYSVLKGDREDWFSHPAIKNLLSLAQKGIP